MALNYSSAISSKKIWKLFNFDTNDWYVKDINNYLNQYSSYYFKEFERSLSLLDMTRNIFKSSNIVYSLDVKKSDLRFNDQMWFYNKNNITFFRIKFANEKNSENNIIKRLNYWRFDLFGIVKMNISLEGWFDMKEYIYLF
ncbi:hypothetical protein [Spiroplasma endosymbiont of Atherix ibis]|uniref:hypothetical protein n=1 Tax=Spiroplasma endosymbiont of Atherix ibis TaxID=3066291 RepID=UPI0030D575D7